MNYLSEYQWICTALGWTLLHSIWQIAMIGIIWFSLRYLVKKSSTSAQYYSGVLALSLMFIAFIGTFSSQLVQQYPDVDIVINSISEEVPVTRETTLTDINNPEPITLDNNIASQEEQTANNGNLFLNAYTMTLLAFIWWLGVCILGIRFLIQWLWMRNLSRSGVHAFLEKDLLRFQSLKRKLGINRTVRFLQSEKISSPLTFGHFKPIVLLPLGMINGFPPEEIEAIILHELAHIRRNDFLINVLQTWIEILFFYHPIVWIISKNIRQLREHLCDDEVIKNTDDKMVYASALLHIQQYVFHNKKELAMKITGNRNSLSKRIHRLFESTSTTASAKKNMNAYLLGLIFLLAIGSYAFTNFKTPTVSIAADKMNVLYIGVDNPITVAVSGVLTEKVQLESDELELVDQGDGHYYAKASSPGKATIKVTPDGQAPQLVSFRVKYIADPTARINRSSGGNMSAEDFKQAKGLSLSLDNFEYDTKCAVNSYNITRVAKDEDVVEIINRGAAFQERTQRLVAKIKAGDIIYFDRVTCQCPGDKEPRPINSLVFKIK